MNREEILRLAAIHVRRYEARVRAGSQGDSNVRLAECQAYLKLWASIRDKGDWDLLSSAERQEVRDAMESGE